MVDGKAVAAAVQEAHADITGGEPIDGVFDRIAEEYGLRSELLRLRFSESYGDAARLHANAKWAQASRGYPGRRFRLNGREFTFVEMVDGGTARVVRTGTDSIVEMAWAPICDEIWEQWGM
ncbi:hypothetical protein [Phenylobacterium sp. 58.2.17]|uniref:hypothetical protein n=1 Tax=Phenylobacterium sp. 58.2.17 TaxID=2969306 RepID=UPI002264E78D|nr:hypothetical protein [Phenylobacterium sp. 58.2.17]MCX7584872.1 hypothetical protein [Phenylobacterium sp. 58.2.17]